MTRRAHIAIAIISLIAHHSVADIVLLTNGDRISGDIQQLDEKSLTIKPDYAPTFAIERGAIRSFTTSTAKVWQIQTRAHSAKISESTTPGQVLLDGVSVAINDLRLSIKKTEPAWRKNGHLGTTVDIDTGTHEGRKEFHIDAELNLESKDWRHNLKTNINYDKDQQSVTENMGEFTYALDYFFDDHWLARSENTYEENNLPPNNQYTLTGAGPGYRFWGEQRNRMDIIATYNYLWFSSDTVDLEFKGWAITLDYMKFWFHDKLETFADVQMVFPDVQAVDPIIDLDVGLRILLTRKIFLSLRYDYNETTTEQERVVDSGYVVGAGINF
ncbi:MAG TPA: DUF481 domain-containing protein [Cellvibrio sp.]|nr:DUF481 domain-containing protein [Cellvibrio sp.]